MLFNSLEFLLFLPIVFTLYWMVNKHLRLQNILLLAASYLFYGWWDWRYLSLIVLSSALDFSLGKALGKTEDIQKRKWLLTTSLVFNLGMLGVFKYYNFFVSSFIDAFATLGITLQASTLHIILPVGISFYTFQTLSYTIDVYRKKIPPIQDVVSFFAFVSFFPQLVAGPIERASNLLPQFQKTRQFKYEEAADGIRQILWGLFKKIVIADTCAIYVNGVYDGISIYEPQTLFIASVLFSFQIYGDFSGYSDIAIGTAKLFGFRLMKNFNVPYFARDIAEFWRRWHISLTSWFTDYIYIPLGGSRAGKWVTIRNVFIIFLVSGFWHGANWTFLFWGGLNALLFMPLLLTGRNRQHLGTVAPNRLLPTFMELLRMITTFILVNFLWIFFRASSISEAFSYFYQMFTGNWWALPVFRRGDLVIIFPLIAIMLLVEWFNRTKSHPLQIQQLKAYQRHGIYIGVIALIFFFGKYHSAEFIYFQF